jgi:hypothetical protein
MHKLKRLAIFLEDTEPATVVGRGGGFVDSRTPLVLDDLSNFVKNPAGDRSLSENPRDV